MRHAFAFSLIVAAASLVACGSSDEERTPADIDHAYMDSLKTMLGELRRMDHVMKQQIAGHGENVDARIILPIIEQDLRPTVTAIRQRAEGLETTDLTAASKELFLEYLETRLIAYNAALEARDEVRPELYEHFALKQTEAEALGRELEDVIYKVRGQMPGYH